MKRSEINETGQESSSSPRTTEELEQRWKELEKLAPNARALTLIGFLAKRPLTADEAKEFVEIIRPQ